MNLKSFLRSSPEPVVVIFEKKDGTERKIRCSLNPKIINEFVEPIDPAVEKKPRKAKPANLLSVVDVDLGQWRTINLDTARVESTND